MPPVSDENSQFVSMSDSGLTAGEPSYSHTTPSPTPALAAAGTEDETQKEQQSRKRTARACDSCYKRKIKCDAAVPQCNWCSHHNIPCTFERVIPRRRKTQGNGPGPHKTARLSERLSRIEKILMENFAGESPRGGSPANSEPSLIEDVVTTPPDHAPASSSVALHFAGREFGVNSLITGIPFLLPEGQLWVEARTGQSIAFEKLSPARPPWEKQRALNSSALLMSLQTQNPFELPSQSVVEIYFDLYRGALMRLIFPVLDFVLFRETIGAAYQPHGSSRFYRPASARACIFSFIALASILHPPGLNQTPANVPPVDSEEFAVKAQCLLPQVLQESASVDGLQTATMLAVFDLVTGNLRSANYFVSLAARFIYMLGAHTYSHQPTTSPAAGPESPEDRIQRHLRNLFWLCYIIDKDIALRTGQPVALSDENCDLTLPPGYAEQQYMAVPHPQDSHNLPNIPIFPVDLRLGIIKSRAYSSLYSFKAHQKTDAELLKEIRELDDELERWRMSVPIEWRPTLSFSHERPDPTVSMHSVMLRLNYHLCMTIIHQASSRCKAWAKGEGQGAMTEGVRSSLALSVEASRSTLLYLETAEHVLMDGVFWHLIFYPMSALLAIFCSILQTPSDPQATKDLGLLRAAMGMMERVFLRQLYSVNEVIHIKLVADFVSELHRLAKCAVDKALNERFM